MNLDFSELSLPLDALGTHRIGDLRPEVCDAVAERLLEFYIRASEQVHVRVMKHEEYETHEYLLYYESSYYGTVVTNREVVDAIAGRAASLKST